MVDLPLDKTLLGVSGFMKLKPGLMVLFECYKACLIGATHKYDINVEETLAFVALFTSVRTLFPL